MVTNSTYPRLGNPPFAHRKKISLSQLLILHAASCLDIQVEPVADSKMYKCSYQNLTRYLRYQTPGNTTWIGLHSARHKGITKSLLKQAGLPIVPGFDIYQKDPVEHWRWVFDTLKKPLVVKPTHGTQGSEVYTDVAEWPRFETIITRLLDEENVNHRGILVEEMVPGNEFRLYVNKDTFVGAYQRIPAHVVGDGTSSIQQLIEQKNNQPQRQDGHDSVLTTIPIDKIVLKHLERADKSLQTVLPKGQTQFLRRNSNISTGGDFKIVTDQVHHSVKELARKTLEAIPGLVLTGIDLMTADITKDQAQTQPFIIEINESPAIYNLDDPLSGVNHFAAIEFFAVLFPEYANEIRANKHRYDPRDVTITND